MRLVFLCKRRYMSKDVIEDRYARLYEIPRQLARLGHEVQAFCLAYQGQSKGEWTHDCEPGTVTWHSTPLNLKSIGYPRALLKTLSQFKPDVLIAASDIPHIVLGGYLARKLAIPYFVDLYDNFEGFGQAKIPFFVSLLRRVTARAQLVTTTSDLLKDYVQTHYSPQGRVVAMPSAVDTAVFCARPKSDCREELGLPKDVKLIGTAGGLYREKGIELLLDAWQRLQHGRPDVHLVLAGPVEKGLELPSGPRVHYLGLLPHEKVAKLFCALDVGVICVLDSAFGRYSFPQKAYEMLACRLPLVVSDVGAMGQLFAKWPSCLAKLGDTEDMVGKILAQLTSPVLPSTDIKDWRGQVAIIDQTIRQLDRSHP